MSRPVREKITLTPGKTHPILNATMVTGELEDHSHEGFTCEEGGCKPAIYWVQRDSLRVYFEFGSRPEWVKVDNEPLAQACRDAVGLGEGKRRKLDAMV